MSFKKKQGQGQGTTTTTAAAKAATSQTAQSTQAGLDPTAIGQMRHLLDANALEIKHMFDEKIGEVSDKMSGFGKALSEFKERADNHEERLVVLEGLAGISQAQPTPPQQTTQPTPPQQTATTQTSSQATASNQTSSPTNIVSCRNGVGMAYCYWDYETQAWVMLSDIWAAKQLSNGTYTPVWVWYENGKIHHKLDPNEVKKYLP